MSYKIGTRIKKVRGAVNVGTTGIVHPGPTTNGHTLKYSTIDSDIYVRVDQAVVSVSGNTIPAGLVVMVRSHDWEPIIPPGSNIPATHTFEQLMEKYKHEDVESLPSTD